MLGSGGAVQRSASLAVLLNLAAFVVTIVAAVGANIATAARAENLGSLDNTPILIIRHAEEDGDGEGLSSEGLARARAYIDYFQTLHSETAPRARSCS